MTLGSTLKARRQELGLSLRDVEKKTDGGISNGYLSLLETDQVKQPSPHHLHMLSSALEMEYARLIELAGYVVPRSLKAHGASAAALAFAGAEDLSDEELRQVKEYIKLLRDARTVRAGRK